jgi:hypothetical protein
MTEGSGSDGRRESLKKEKDKSGSGPPEVKYPMDGTKDHPGGSKPWSGPKARTGTDRKVKDLEVLKGAEDVKNARSAPGKPVTETREPEGEHRRSQATTGGQALMETSVKLPGGNKPLKSGIP